MTNTEERHGMAAEAGLPPLRGRLHHDVSMDRYTSWRVGGTADRMYVPADEADLAEFLARQPRDETLYWIGLGSNVLVRDGGLRGTVILLSGALSELRLEGVHTVRAGAGVACAKAARFAAEHGLSGIEFLAGIPGTIGGALAMNAGAHGSEIWNHVETVRLVDRGGRLSEQPASGFRVGYRSVDMPADTWFTGARLRLQPDSSGTASARIREYLALRNRNQPTGRFSCGSVFRNPPGNFAGRLIEECGLKGMRIGHAVVSAKHANFIINEGGASAADIEALIRMLQETVSRRTGIQLQPEVRIMGTPASGEPGEAGR